MFTFPTLLRSTTVRAAKAHQCGGCLAPIERAELHTSEVLVAAGQFLAQRVCGTCTDRR